MAPSSVYRWIPCVSKGAPKPPTITQPPIASVPTSLKAHTDAVKDDFLKALRSAGIEGSIESRGIEFDIHIIPWNLRVQPKPLALVYAADPQDVALAVQVAARFSIPVQPRSGGHSFASYSLGGNSGALVIDLKAINTVHVDQKTWQATIGGGTRLDQVTKQLYAQGKRTIAHGTCPQVGIGGHATIGGQGPLSRMYGLTLDHIIDCEVVLADGTITHANATKNPDLFWALRGAGASFGIVTTFTVETHPALDEVTHYSFQLTLGSPETLAAAVGKWQDFINSPVVKDDRKFNSVITITKGAVLVQGTRYGTLAELQASEVYILMNKHFTIDVKTWTLEWLASFMHWATDEIENISGGLSIPAYIKSFVVRKDKLLTAAALAAWFDYMHTHSSEDTVWVVLGDLEAGRIGDFSNDATAYAHRDALYTMTIYALAPLPFPDQALAFLGGMVDTVATAMGPDNNFGVYPGYVDPLIPKTQWPTQYWGANYPRLLDVKATYDPKNVFANPQSVGSECRRLEA